MHKDFPVIKTNEFVLRQFTGSDVNYVFEGLSHPKIIKYYGVSYPSLAATQAQMKWFKSLEENKTGIWWAMCDIANKTCYGAIGLSNLSNLHKKAEIGFWLLPAYWGKGMMLEAINLVCNYGFEQMKLHRIEAMVESENKNCKNLMDKLNFKYEETMHDCEIKNGSFISLEIYARLRNKAEYTGRY
ncbi:MAG: GNAT family protein [Bacteroidota bacterium]